MLHMPLPHARKGLHQLLLVLIFFSCQHITKLLQQRLVLPSPQPLGFRQRQCDGTIRIGCKHRRCLRSNVAPRRGKLFELVTAMVAEILVCSGLWISLEILRIPFANRSPFSCAPSAVLACCTCIGTFFWQEELPRASKTCLYICKMARFTWVAAAWSTSWWSSVMSVSIFTCT